MGNFWIELEKIVFSTIPLRGKTILEIGCGKGQRASSVSAKCSQAIGVDISKTMAKSRLQNLAFCQSTGYCLPFQNETFDAVTSFDVIEHVQDDILFLQEAKRVLRKNGILFVETPNRDRIINKAKALVGNPTKYPYTLGPNCVHLREYTKDQLLSLANKVNFRRVIVEGFWFGTTSQRISISHPPSFLNKYAQAWLLIAQK